MLILEDHHGRAEIHPEQGGGIGRYDIKTADGHREIFRPDARRRGAFALGCNVLLPFSNRISGGGFRHEGIFHPLEPNIEGNPFPTHGNAFTSAWNIVETTATRVALSLISFGPGPFRYRAELLYALAEGTLRMTLRATNTAAMSLPFGAGFHPWFVRTSSTRLQFSAAGFWSEKSNHLPESYHSIDTAEEMDFTSARELPIGWINTAYTGWDGKALIDWPDRGIGVTITAPTPLSTAILYSPSANADFFCFEPVSHSVDTHNSNPAGSTPPQALQPGETLAAEMHIRTHFGARHSNI